MMKRTCRFAMAAAALAIFLVVAKTPAAGEETTKGTKPMAAKRIVFLGDSITDGFTYPLMVRQALADAGQPVPIVINAGIGGDTAAGMIQRLDRDVLVHKPDLMSVSVGINDVLRGVPLEDYVRDVRAILERMKKEGVPVLVMTTTVLGPKHEAKHKALAAMNAALRELAGEYGCAVAEVNESMANAVKEGDEPLEGDEIHINPAGYRIMTRAVLDGLGYADVPAPEALRVEALPGVVTPWRIRSHNEKEPLDEDEAAALVPDDAWGTLTLPETKAQKSWWSDQVRQRGFALSLDKVAGKAKRYYGVAIVPSDKDAKVFLNTGGHLRRAWLNGEKVYENEGWTGYHAGKERVPVALKQGDNTLVIETGAQFFLSITENNDW